MHVHSDACASNAQKSIYYWYMCTLMHVPVVCNKSMVVPDEFYGFGYN